MFPNNFIKGISENIPITGTYHYMKYEGEGNSFFPRKYLLLALRNQSQLEKKIIILELLNEAIYRVTIRKLTMAIYEQPIRNL